MRAIRGRKIGSSRKTIAERRESLGGQGEARSHEFLRDIKPPDLTDFGNSKALIRSAVPREAPGDRSGWLQHWTAELGCVESPEYLQRVFDWRRAWRPKRIKFLLVAESHVAESVGDLDVRVKLPSSLELPSLPDGFCRLIYCLGYGESKICTPTPQSNPGTYQFWDLFGSMASIFEPAIPARMPRRDESSLSVRLQWKVSVLTVFLKAGVWVEDASVLAIYAPSGIRRAQGSRYRQVLRQSFERYVWPEVSHDNVSGVWVIGRGVAQALAGLPMIAEERVISQPQNRDRSRYREDLRRLHHAIAQACV